MCIYNTCIFTYTYICVCVSIEIAHKNYVLYMNYYKGLRSLHLLEDTLREHFIL